MPGSRGGALPAPFEVRFWTKVDRTKTCWLWTGAVNDSGYGVILGDEKRLVYAHRSAYEKLVGPVPDGLTLDHLCHTKACVNPAHLEPVSAVENTHRAAAARTTCRRGHPRTPENTQWSGGVRSCRVCGRISRRNRRAAA